MTFPLIRFPRPEIQELVEELTGTIVVWDNEPLPMAGQINGRAGYYVQLSVIATKTKGIDEFRPTFDPVKPRNSIQQISYRIYTVQFKANSYSKDVPAFDVIDQIRRGLRSLTGKSRFLEAGLAFVEFGMTRDLPADADNRETSVSMMDCKLAWQVAVDPGDDDGGWIDQVATLTDDLTP